MFSRCWHQVMGIEARSNPHHTRYCHQALNRYSSRVTATVNGRPSLAFTHGQMEYKVRNNTYVRTHSHLAAGHGSLYHIVRLGLLPSNLLQPFRGVRIDLRDLDLRLFATFLRHGCLLCCTGRGRTISEVRDPWYVAEPVGSLACGRLKRLRYSDLPATEPGLRNCEV